VSKRIDSAAAYVADLLHHHDHLTNSPRVAYALSQLGEAILDEAREPRQQPQPTSAPEGATSGQRWCSHVGGWGPPFPLCQICAGSEQQPQPSEAARVWRVYQDEREALKREISSAAQQLDQLNAPKVEDGQRMSLGRRVQVMAAGAQLRVVEVLQEANAAIRSVNGAGSIVLDNLIEREAKRGT
jgi:hypothetical protein